MLSVITWCLAAFSLSAKLYEKVINLLSVTASPSHHQCLTWLWPWSSVSSHTLNAGCLTPIGGSQLLLACFACLVLAWFSSFVWWWWWGLSPEAPVIYVYVSLASLNRGSSALFSMCDTVVILMFVQDYHSTYCAVLFSSPHGSNLTDIQHTDLF